MRIAYFDCFSGISGDMILGALLNAGLDVDALKQEWGKLPIPEWTLDVREVVKHGITATDICLHVEDHDGDHPHHHGASHHSHGHTASRSYDQLAAILRASTLDGDVVETSLAIFGKVAEAEAKIHNTTPDKIHFHELGGLDTIFDVVGAVVGLTLLGVEKVYSSPLPLSHGSVTCAHGVYPVPAPAVLELLCGASFRSTDIEGELITPTGAAVLAYYNPEFLSPPNFRVTAIGWGAGKKDFQIPNVLRVVIGDAMDVESNTEARTGGILTESLHLLETSIDDMNPQHYELVMEKAFQSGALDVTLTPIQMKKNRPGVRLEILCETQKTEELMRLLFRETTTLGVRVVPVDRHSLPREVKTVETPYGPVRVKVGFLDGSPINYSPEYDDCSRIARERGCTLQDVAGEAVQIARSTFLDKGYPAR